MGETLHGNSFKMGFGGKGANQAVMASRLGAEVVMIGKVGKDIFGENTLRNFRSLSIDTRYVMSTDRAFSGVATISVDREGNNAIVIVSGANDLISEEEIEQARDDIAKSAVMICQLEIPPEITLKALRVAREEGVMTILNPAPARFGLPDEFYKLSDILCPNESETEILTGKTVRTADDLEQAGMVFLERGVKAAVITLGERGCLLITEQERKYVPAKKVKALDTTGAGDAFIGSMAFYLAKGKSLAESTLKANAIAALSVQAYGTQSSFPEASDLADDYLD